MTKEKLTQHMTTLSMDAAAIAEMTGTPVQTVTLYKNGSAPIPQNFASEILALLPTEGVE